MKEVKKYRKIVIKQMVKKYPDSDYKYWNKCWPDRARYFVSSEGYIYELYGDYLAPLHWWEVEIIRKNLLPGHKIHPCPSELPIACLCGQTELMIYQDGYETLASCPKCGRKFTVHSG